MKKIVTKTFQYGTHTVTLETGKIARQADAAVLVTMGETVVLVTVVAVKQTAEGQDFFPLTVNYQEKTYAAGRIPGGYFKREGRPSERETLTSRLIDRPIRPLFPEGFLNEIQVVATVLSLDNNVPSDIPALLGASAALSLTGVPFEGPLGAARVGYVNGSFILNPSATEMAGSALDLVVAGTAKAVLMVESEAKELPEQTMLEAVWYGHQELQTAVKAINEFVAESGRTPWQWSAPTIPNTLTEKVKHLAGNDLGQAYQIADKIARNQKISQLRSKVIDQIHTEHHHEFTSQTIANAFNTLESNIVREKALQGLRIDGRTSTDIRPISINLTFLPRAHGSAVFTRGETQAVVVATLGTERDAQLIDALEGEYRDNFMLHYNFPPYCVGETGPMGSPKRREIGHGNLAKRAIKAVLPAPEECPYVLRVVSEITESNGSSSMATVCGTSLALMDAGVPIRAAVAGIAMGLVKEGERYAVLSDIMGDEDHLGDMDFKVAGTANGVTALQMDIKISGITQEIMDKALQQAKAGREHILSEMNKNLSTARTDVAAHAPRIITIKINPDRIRDVIGKGGATIRSITEETSTSIDISPDGTVKIASTESKNGNEALRRVKMLTDDVEVGGIYNGQVCKILEFGALVELLPGKVGMVHISQITSEHVSNVRDYLEEGQTVRVKVLEVDRQGRIRLSMKELSTADSE